MMTRTTSFWSELKRRNVFRVAAAYAVVAWLLVQAADILLSNFGAPDWVFKTFLVLVVLGLPLALVLSWAYEITPEGVKKTEEVHPNESITRATGRKLDFIVFGVLALALALGWVVWDKYLREPAPPPVEPAAAREASIAVLPLRNLMGDPAQDYFVEGMHEALIAELSKISALKVISRTSTMRYRDTAEATPQIARELGVNSLVEGSVLRAGDQVRISVQLIDGPADRHLWAQTFDRELLGILALQSEVARAIAGEIRVKLTQQEQVRLTSARPVNPEAYELYLRGRHYWNQRTIHGFNQAIENFQKAVEQDSGLTPAYAALADSYMMLGQQGGMLQKEARPLAEAAIRRALEVNDSVAEVHAALGEWKLSYEWNWVEAEQAFKRATELTPSDAWVRARYGRFLGFLGRFEESVTELQRAKVLDPLSIPVDAYLGQVYIFAKQYDRAAELLQRTSELNPNHALIRHNLGELYLAQGRFAEAIPELERSVELSGQLSAVPSSHYLAILGCAYARANRREDATKILSGLQRRSKQSLVSSFDIAILHTALGEKERALVQLEQGYEQRDIWLVQLRSWPWFDALRDDPRFQALLQRMNFPENQGK